MLYDINLFGPSFSRRRVTQQVFARPNYRTRMLFQRGNNCASRVLGCAMNAGDLLGSGTIFGRR